MLAAVVWVVMMAVGHVMCGNASGYGSVAVADDGWVWWVWWMIVDGGRVTGLALGSGVSV